jgi:hypothetical protein
MCPIGSGWPQIEFKFGFNTIMFLVNPNEPNLNLFGVGLGPIWGRVGPPGSKFGFSWVGPQGSKFGLSWVGLVGFTQPVSNLQSFRCGTVKS